MTLVFNNKDNVFKEGDVIYITNSLAPREECYSVVIKKVLTSEECGGLGVHYVYVVSTYIDDYMGIREANRCFRSPEQYQELRQEAIDQMKAFKKRIEDAKTRSLAGFTRAYHGDGSFTVNTVTESDE